MATSQDDLRDRPIGDLLKQLSQETTTLVKQELDLAKAEITQKGRAPGPAPACSVAARCSASARSAR